MGDYMSRLTLQYLWIERYCCYSNSEFNFSEKYNIRYDFEKNKLILGEMNEDYVSHFFTKNIDITAIVGKNGAGKTTLLRFLLSIFNINKNVSEKDYPSKFIIVFEVDKKLVAYYNGLKYLNNSSTDFEIINIEEVSFENLGLRYIYFSNVLSYMETLENYGNENIISTSFLLSQSINNMPKERMQIGFTHYFHQETERQIKFIANHKNALNQFHIRYPKKCTVSVIKDLINTSKWYGSQHNKKLFEEFFVQSHDVGVEAFKEYIARSTFSSLIKSFDNAFPFVDDEDYQKITDIIESELGNTGNPSSNALDNFKKLLVNIEKSKLQVFELRPLINEKYWVIPKTSDYYEFIELIEKYIVQNKKLSEWHIGEAFDVNFEDEGNEISIASFFKKYSTIGILCDFLTFSFNLSSGENALLTIFSRISQLKRNVGGRQFIGLDNNKKINEAASNIIFVIDEADMLLHPEWQQKFLESFLKFINNLVDDTHFQIIVATHSPIILSDIPKQNVVYLDKDETGCVVVNKEIQPETFGSNIFKLYNNAFFMEQGAIGSFAKEKLTELLKDILDGDGDENDIQHRINLIGDTFLKERFQNQFNEVYSKSESIETEINRLKARINELETIYREKK